jgi:lysophospholipase L1-like esterase
MIGGLRQQALVATAGETIEIRAIRGRPQLFGVTMETQQPGFVIDTLGINGARFGTFLSWDEAALAPLIGQRRPALLVIAYGTNEVFDSESVERHARKLELVIERLRGSASEADCLVIGPTDVSKGGEAMRARAAAMDSAERATADKMACAYFSPYELMASEGGFDSWSRQAPPLSVGDGIHLTARGYARLGEALATQLLAPLEGE